MPINVFVPRLGEGVEEVTITKWLKQVGQTVHELEPLLEVNTDKVDTEIPAPASGRLSSIVQAEGQTAKVGELLAVIETEAASSSQPPADNPPPTVARPQASAATFISPVVAKIAAEKAIDLRQVHGSGLNGRITKEDVLAFVEKAESKPAAEEPKKERESSEKPGEQPARQAENPARIPHTAIRRSIAKHMVDSKHSSPHVLTVMEADLSRIIAHRAAHKAAFARDGVNLTFTAYFMQALVAGLKTYPQVNSSWSDEALILHPSIHLGMATSLGEDGLIVPVIKNAENLSLLGMARAVNDLAARARARKLQPEEVRGGTFTLTNHGISGSLFAFPVINQPQCGILGVGALQKRVMVISDELGRDSLAIRPMVYLSFVFDHRILDGASADWFLAKVKEALEKWE